MVAALFYLILYRWKNIITLARERRKPSFIITPTLTAESCLINSIEWDNNGLLTCSLKSLIRRIECGQLNLCPLGWWNVIIPISVTYISIWLLLLPDLLPDRYCDCSCWHNSKPELNHMTSQNGIIGHTIIRIGDSILMMSDARRGWKSTPSTIYLREWYMCYT